MWSAAHSLCVLLSLWASGLCHTLLTVGSCVVNRENVTFDCSGRDLTSVPQYIWPNVTMLDLSENHLNIVNSKALTTLQHFDRLITLNLSGNYLPLLAKQIFPHLPSLKILDLRGCQLAALEPGALMSLPKLQKLLLGNNDLKHPISAVIQDHGWIEYVELGDNHHQNDRSKKIRGMRGKVFQPMDQEILYEGHDDILTHVHFQRRLLASEGSTNTKNTTTAAPTTTSNGTTDVRKPPGDTWKYLVAVLVTAISLSILIAVGAKCKLLHRYLASYRHARLRETDTASHCDPAAFEVNFSQNTGRPEPPAGGGGTTEDDDGFIEDNYIQASERERAARESDTWDEEEEGQEEEEEDELQFTIG